MGRGRDAAVEMVAIGSIGIGGGVIGGVAALLKDDSFWKGFEYAGIGSLGIYILMTEVIPRIFRRQS